MITKYTIKNFRVFDENGVSFDLKPLTILTGCNSSGKSSIVKSLLLLCDYLSSLKEDKKNGKKPILTSHELDFMKKPHSKLGRFKKIVNNTSKSENKKKQYAQSLFISMAEADGYVHPKESAIIEQIVDDKACSSINEH